MTESLINGENSLEQNNSMDYNAESITVLRGLDAVRKRPGMYIGDTDDGSGLLQMIFETADNSMDEALAGHCNEITITLHPGNIVSVRDNGRGIPIDIHKEEGVSAVEVIMTQLHAGGKFNTNSYKVSGGLHGVGVSVVNALSDWLEVKIWRDNKEYFVRFSNGGVTESPLRLIGDAPGMKGTEVSFMASVATFRNIEYNFTVLEHRMRELGFLNPGVNLYLKDLRNPEEILDRHFYFEGGIKEYVKFLDRSKNCLHEVIHITGDCVVEGKPINVAIALQWNDSYTENAVCFTNNIRQREGGTHLTGFRNALTRTINNYITNNQSNKNKNLVFTGEDMREGLTYIISVKLPDPKFSSQTKDKLVSSEVRVALETVTNENLANWFEENPALVKIIIVKITESLAAREAARKARELARKKTGLEISNLPGKLSDCREKNPELSELFVAEGESAAGSCRQGRDSGFQAVLPLRGKVLNIERASFDKVLGSEQIGTLITALGCSIGKFDFDINKLRYHKIIIMCDADIDGSHIRTLLLTFFFRHMREVIEKGYLYIAQPPLYKAKKGSRETYLKNDQELQDFILSISMDASQLKIGDQLVEVEEFKRITTNCLNFVEFLSNINLPVDLEIVETLAINGFFAPNVIDDREKSLEIASSAFRKLNGNHHETFLWHSSINENGDLVLSRISKDIPEKIVLEKSFIASSEALKLHILAEKLDKLFDNQNLELIRNNHSEIMTSPHKFKQKLIEDASKNIQVQRFKGLGEMNPEQLWETTLDPNKRTLLQVKIDYLDEAEEIFSTLMGSIVEPRREFIQQNASKVKNLDV